MNRKTEHAPILHVACLVYPSYQGTQAAIGAMLHAAAQTGGPRSHLLSYAHGAYEADCPFEHHRVPDFPKNISLRSGPSLRKVALDLRCVAELRRLAAELRPAAVLAHHVEAAAAAVAARVRPVYYVAHTSLTDELPEYFPRLPSRPIATIAGLCERSLCASVDGIAAVAPSLAERLGPHTRYLPVPWTGATSERTAASRLSARASLGLDAAASVCLYAGNLDAYQGWEHLLGALAELRRTRPEARLLVATESNPAPVQALARRHALQDALLVRRLAGESARATLHAAADLAWIPRRTPGGLPIKMLDAFSRGLPVVAMERATAGLEVSGACLAVANDDPVALARAAEQVLSDPDQARQLARNAEHYLSTRHSAAAFNAALDDWTGRTGTVAELRRAAAQAARAEAVRQAR
jgi:glycosyltransferase involved in cell wall biosynthesis